MLARIRFYHVLCLFMACAVITAGVAADFDMPHLSMALKLLAALSFVAICNLVVS